MTTTETAVAGSAASRCWADLRHGNCLDIMPTLQQGSVNMVLCDMPYGTTACKWDSVLPLDDVWGLLDKCAKPNGAIVLHCKQPFTTQLVASNIKNFRYTWVWQKLIPSNFMNAKKMPLFGFEELAVFYRMLPTYNPQMTGGAAFKDNRKRGRFLEKDAFGSLPGHCPQDNKGTRYPTGIVTISARNNAPVHPTQKPVALAEYFINTYTNPGDTVLDFTMGSGTTGVACMNTGRNFIGVELDAGYFEIAKKRIGDAQGCPPNPRDQRADQEANRGK